ncbi:MAG: zinc-dependent dehydrogenase [Nitrososphaeria archaeon]
MKAAVFYAPSNIRVEERPIPQIARGEVLVKVKAAAICGTDLRIYTGAKKIQTPKIIGHEFAGEVEEVGEDVTGVGLGDRVTVYPVISCGKCYACMMGRRNICVQRPTIGYEYDGGFAEYVRIPSDAIIAGSLIKLPDKITYEEAAITEPLAACLNGMMRLDVKHGEHVWIAGAGPIGLMHVQLARLAGASLVIVSEVNEFRAKKAQEFGADIVVNPVKEDVFQNIMHATEGKGADKIMIAAGVPRLIGDSLKAARKGARIVIFAGSPEDSSITIDPNIIHYKEIELTGASAATPFLHRKAVELVNNRRINLRSLITHTLRLEEIVKGLEMKQMVEGLKTLVTP